jgi:hypothetical protein
MITTWQEFIDNPDTAKVYLAEIEPAKVMTGWTQHPTYTSCYSVSWPGERFSDNDVSRVKQNDTFLTERATLVDCNNNAGSWFLDSAAHLLYAHATTHADPDTFTMLVYFWIYFKTPSRNAIFNNIMYMPLLDTVPSLSANNQQLVFGRASMSSGRMVLKNGQDSDWGDTGPFDEVIYDWIWKNKKVRILVGGEDLPYSEYKLSWLGLIDEPERNNSAVIFTLLDILSVLQTKIPTETYATGTGAGQYQYLEPGAEGKPIPIIYGWCYNVRPTQINTTTWRFKLAGHALKGIDKVRENGVDITTNATMDLANGEFTLSAYAGGVITCDVRGKKTGTTLINYYGNIFYDLVTSYGGLTAADLDAAQLPTQMNIDADYWLGIVIDSIQEIESILSILDLSCMAWHGKLRNGLLTAKVSVLPDPAQVDKQTYTEVEVLESSERLSHQNLYYRVRVGYKKNWYVQNNTSTKVGDGKENWSYDYLWAIAENLPTKYKYDCQEVKEIKTYLMEETNAQYLANAMLAFVKEPWLIATQKVKLKPVDAELGHTIVINKNRFSLTDNDYNLQLIDFDEDHDKSTITMKAFKVLGG